jgi:hypothetical protein
LPFILESFHEIFAFDHSNGKHLKMELSRMLYASLVKRKTQLSYEKEKIENFIFKNMNENTEDFQEEVEVKRIISHPEFVLFHAFASVCFQSFNL